MEVCRLCLALLESNNYSKLTDPYKCIVNSLIPEVNLDITIDPSICYQCSNLVNKLHEFKLACFECQQQRKKTLSKPGCCQTCLKSYEKEIVVNPPNLNSILESCLPEMDLHFIPDPNVCKKCLLRLQRLHQLKTAYLEVEEKLNSFIVNEKGPIDLRKVLHGSHDSNLDLVDAKTVENLEDEFEGKRSINHHHINSDDHDQTTITTKCTTPPVPRLRPSSRSDSQPVRNIAWPVLIHAFEIFAG